MATEKEKSSLEMFEAHTRSYERKHKNKLLPRRSSWIPYRFCVRDVVIAIVVCRHDSNKNRLLVDVFDSYNPAVLEEFSGTKIATVFVISEAFMSGSDMNIEFTSSFGRHPICLDENLIELSISLGIDLNSVQEGKISAFEAKELYLKLTDITEKSKEIANELEAKGLITTNRICFMVHHGIWESNEMDIILQTHPIPNAMLLGTTHPLNRQMQLVHLQVGAMAIIQTLLITHLSNRKEVIVNDTFVDIEANDSNLKYEFDPQTHITTFTSSESFDVPWLYGGSKITVEPGQNLKVLIIPHHMGIDIFKIGIYSKIFNENKSDDSSYFAICIPYDNMYFAEKLRGSIKEAYDMGILIMVCPELADNLDVAVIDRIQESKVIRK